MFEGPVPKAFINFAGEPDFRVRKWPLSNGPKWPTTVLICYFTFLYFGRKFMKDRKPLNLKFVLLGHNYFQIVLSAYIFKEVLICVMKMANSITCFPLDQTEDPISLRLAEAYWYFYVSKFYDLLDTVFLVLRKKEEQLSFLHIYHHSTMIFNWYLGVLYLPGGQSYLSVLLNSFVHIVMYSYYFLSSFGPWTQKYLWWKKYLTQMQLIQFFTIIGHVCYGIYSGCEQPLWLSYFSISYLSTLIVLFTHFYIKIYRHKKSSSSKKQKSIYTLASTPIKIEREIIDIMASGDKKDL